MTTRPRRFKTVAITITHGQDEYIAAQTQGNRDKSRWIRDAISMRMLAEANAQVGFVEKYRTQVMKDALEVAQNTIDPKHTGNPDSSGYETHSDTGVTVEIQPKKC